MKTYSTKANAIRAAKAAGWVPGDYEIIEVGDKFGYQLNEAEDTSEGEALEVMEQERDEAQNPDAPADEPQPEEAPAPVAKVRNASTVESPTRRVWAIADELHAANPDVRRKDIMAACEAAGIAFFTARTQIQKWMKAKKEGATE
ncbi:hypothetical protein QMA71_24980 [Pseudomonas otitidis]|uniref:hypothetical protein n=1 Tax=Metapseudomonas otitidis TaxID=319939 RepID=UPI0024AC95FC|nr:hypothetical protein [Pseudomonas otitidis]MDI6528801.1 hypothetical protein [Pseudomonas otitidis]